MSQQFQKITHDGESKSDQIRDSIQRLQPRAQRTKTPSLAVLSRSEGCFHYTPEGRKLADFSSGVLVANLGHNPPDWWQRVMGYMQLSPLFDSGVTLTAYNAITEVESEATRRLLENLQSFPGGVRMEQLLWAASGSEAIQKAIWASMTFKEVPDPIILATRHGFHGKKGLAGAVTGSEADPERDSRVHFISFPKAECSSIVKRRESIDLSRYRAELDECLARFGQRIVCLCTEPYLGGGGSFHPQPEYLQMLQEFCREHDIIFILDEVQSNFGRTGEMYAYTHYGLEPDMVVLGKGMGNGMSVDAVAGRCDVLSSLEYGEGSDTWSANPLGCAGVLATLDGFADGSVLIHAKQLSEVISTGLQRLVELPMIEQVRGEGTVWGIECCNLGDRTAAEVATEIVRRCYLGDEKGRAIHLLGPLAEKVIRVSPPLVLALEDAREYLDVLYEIAKSING